MDKWEELKRGAGFRREGLLKKLESEDTTPSDKNKYADQIQILDELALIMLRLEFVEEATRKEGN